MAPVLSPVKPVYQAVAPVLSPVKPAYQTIESSSEAKSATPKEDITVQSASVTDPVQRDGSPQRKKARRVVLQTISTSVENIAKAPCEIMSGGTDVAKNVVFDEKCRLSVSHADKPECMEVCGDVQVTEVGSDLY